MGGSREGGENRDLARAFAELEADEPGFEIFRRRRLAVGEKPPTLRELGIELGISHERVRQREAQERDAIADRMEDREWPVRIAVDRIRDCFGALGRPRKLAEVLTELDLAEALERSLHRRALLLHLAGYRISNLWVQRVGLDSETDELLGGLTKDGPADLGDVRRGLVALGVKSALTRPWIEDRPGFRLIDEMVARGSQTMETALAVLRAAGKPLDLGALHTAAGIGVSAVSFRSHIQHDERFMRRGVRHYGLSAWGGERYTAIAEKMIEEIERNGGAIDLNLLTESLVERFGVAEGSVRDRARAPQFAVDSEGRISCRVRPLVVPPAPLALTHGCFRLEQGWALRLVVDRYLLQGCASRMPFAFARALGLRLGLSQNFSHPFGELHAYWPRYAISAANLGSVRVAARELGADEGDRLFVIRCSEDWLDLRLHERRALEAASGIERLALECGFEPGEEPLGQVLLGLGLDPHLAGAEEAISVRMRARHERRLLAGWDLR